MSRMISRAALAAALLAVIAIPSASANSLYTDQPATPTGHFEWDVFDLLGEVGFAGPHAPDVSATGIGTASLTATAAGADFPPPGITSTNNLYTGARIGSFNTNLIGAEDSAAQTTFVLQIAAFGDIAASSLLLGNAAPPTALVDRGAAPGGLHYYWAEWQAAAASSLNVTFMGGHPHFSLAGIQLDYYNGTTPYDAVAPSPVPEPAALALAGFGIAGIGLRRRRRAGR
jgi:hypothetical protein